MLSTGCQWRRQPNVVILLVDTLRADRLGCYGHVRQTSPTVDALARKGIVFSRCYAPSDYTSATTASLFTGLYPLAHGYVHADYALEESNLTLAEIFAQQGYRTAAFVANGLAGEKYHMDQGFEIFYEKNRATAAELVQQASDFIARHRDEPFLVYMHFMEVHDPHRIPASQVERFAAPGQFTRDMQDTLLLEKTIMDAWWGKEQEWWENAVVRSDAAAYFDAYAALYDAAIYYWDESAGALLQALAAHGLDGETIVVVTSDHGEQLLEHGYFGHANSGYDVGLHVPLVVYDPLLLERAGKELDHPVGSIDILPTLLARLGADIPAAIQGRERWSLMRGEQAPQNAPGVYSEGTFMRNHPFSTLIQTYREGPWKLILDRLRDTKELYDLARDPGETQDLFAARPEIAARLGGHIRELYNRNLQIFDARERSGRERQEEKMRELLALGYFSSTGAGKSAEFFPMRPLRLRQFGPFGDEEDLARFTDRVDFVRGPAVAGQILRGYRDEVGKLDPAGAFFDRRATFLLRNADAGTHIEVDLYIDPAGGADNPAAIQFYFDGEPGARFALDGPGSYRFAQQLPGEIARKEYFYAELRADGRFLLRAGQSPRTDQYAALKIRRVSLEK